MKQNLFSCSNSVCFLFPGCLLLVLAVFLVFTMPMPVRAGSAHSFNSGMNCYGVYKLPDTGQIVHYSVAAGDDSDYRPALTQPGYNVLNPVDISSVTVDNVTRLMWITNPETDAGMGGLYTWTNAIAACEGASYAGYLDWRLPNVRELLSIVNYQNMSPAINTSAFPGTRSNYYWTSTTYVSSSASVWGVDFLAGVVSIGSSKTGTSYVRCVRRGW